MTHKFQSSSRLCQPPVDLHVFRIDVPAGNLEAHWAVRFSGFGQTSLRQKGTKPSLFSEGRAISVAWVAPSRDPENCPCLVDTLRKKLFGRIYLSWVLFLVMCSLLFFLQVRHRQSATGCCNIIDHRIFQELLMTAERSPKGGCNVVASESCFDQKANLGKSPVLECK